MVSKTVIAEANNREKVCRIVADACNRDYTQISSYDQLRKDLGLDPQGLWIILNSLKEQFGIKVSHDDIFKNCGSGSLDMAVGDLCSLVTAKITERAERQKRKWVPVHRRFIQMIRSFPR